MLSILLQATNGRFVARSTAAPHAVQATEVLPTRSCELLVENLSRPYADSILAGDRLTLRFAVSNTLWSFELVGVHIYELRANREQLRVPDNLAVFTVADVDMGDLARPRIRLTAPIPEHRLVPRGNTLVRILPRPRSPSLGVFTNLTDLTTIGGDDGWMVVRNNPVKARSRTMDGRLLQRGNLGGPAPELHPVSDATGSAEQELVFSRVGDAWSRVIRSGQRIVLGTPDGLKMSLRSSRFLEFRAAAEPVELEVRRAAGPGVLQHGDIFTLHAVVGDRRLPVRVGARLECAPSGDPDRLIFEDRKELFLHWHATREDNASVSSPLAGYVLVRPQAQVLIGPKAETVPLKRFFHLHRGDHFTTATEKGQQDALAAGYRYDGVEGWAYAAPQTGTQPLRLYWHAGRADNFLACTVEDERSAGDAGYTFAHVEGHAFAPALVPPDASSSSEEEGVFGSRTLRHGVADMLTPELRERGRFVSDVYVSDAFRRAPKKALVLSGGGAKGAFEAGVIQALWERGYRPDIVTGVSVGALNGTFIAQGHDGAADDLVALWRSVSARRAAPRLKNPDELVELGDAYRNNHYAALYEKLFVHLGARFGGTVGPTVAGMGIGSAVLGPLGALLGAIVGLEGGVGDTDERLTRAIRAFFLSFHCAHSMEPLRRLIGRTLDDAFLDRLRASRILLRIGLTNIETGELLTVGKPIDAAGELSRMSIVDSEPDHTRGRTWATQPLFGAHFTLLPFAQALYASCALPYFMEPIVADLQGARPAMDGGSRFVTVPLDIPAELRLLLEVSGLPLAQEPESIPSYLDHLDYGQVERALDQIIARFPGSSSAEIAAAAALDADGARGKGSQRHHLFDGGLRDTMPIRTALRHGARDITVITGDRLQQATKTYPTVLAPGASVTSILDIARFTLPSFSGVDLAAIPGMQHVLGLLNIWFNDSARSDVLLAGAHGELVNWTKRAYDSLDASARGRLAETARRYFARQRQTWTETLGASTWLGGEGPRSRYGEPLVGEEITIRYIAPDRDILGALDFDNREGIEEAIALGKERANDPDVLVSPDVS